MCLQQKASHQTSIQLHCAGKFFVKKLGRATRGRGDIAERPLNAPLQSVYSVRLGELAVSFAGHKLQTVCHLISET